MEYVELQVTSNFSFLRGASHPEELVEQAARLGYRAIAITDRNSLAGIVRAHVAAKKCGIRLVTGCRLDLLDGPSLLVYPQNKAAYSSLCRMLSKGNSRTEKGQCHLYTTDVFEHAKDMILIVLPPERLEENCQIPENFREALSKYRQNFNHQLHLAVCRRYDAYDNKYIYRLAELAEQSDVPLVATNDVHYHEPGRRPLQDVVTCIREKCTINTAGFRLHANAERFLKEQQEMMRLFRQYPHAISRTAAIADACTFSLDSLKYEYPREITSEGRTPQEELTKLAWEGAREKFGYTLPEKTAAALGYELEFISKMNYASYFLTVYDIVRFARSKDILCQGRGSAANSTVCYCLGITSVDPSKFDLLFERFISTARNEPPDIDVDFEHERREEVIQYIYNKYGRDRAAIVATVTCQHQKGALRDVAKVMGISVDTINQLSGSIWDSIADRIGKANILEQGLDPGNRHLLKVLELTHAFIGFPRQLGQHTGGFVITEGRLTDLCPVLNARMDNRTCIEWNKDDIDALGFMKVDVLALGMLTCIRKSFGLARQHYRLDLTLANIPQDDPAVYDMISHADTIGVFQIESRAQQSMLPRLRPKKFYDLVIEVAIVRPGPIQGDMVHPYLRRRNGEEEIEYPSKELEQILKRTLGVPLFQEQAMKIAIVAAGFTPGEADELRRSMATFKAKGMVSSFQNKLIKGMTERGYSADYAQRVFRQLEGFGSYGFPESHAASFALLVYVSSWMKCFYPDVFACALLNSMPMGFYQPAQIVMDAKNHGVEVRAVDVNFSCRDHTLEESSGKYKALRLGFRQISGIREEDILALLQARKNPFREIDELRCLELPHSFLEALADADAFRSMGLDRRSVLWQLATKDNPIQLFRGRPPVEAVNENVQLPLMRESEHVVQDYSSTSLSLKAHPVSFLRPALDRFSITSIRDLPGLKNGDYVKIAGLVLVRQRPGTSKGVIFMTIEDETGWANLVVFKDKFECYRREILQSRLIMVEGTLQIEGEVIHLVVSVCHNFSGLLRQLTSSQKEQAALLTISSRDEKPDSDKLFGDARNFR